MVFVCNKLKIYLRVVTNMSHSYVVIDFETTGFSPDNGDRIIEVAAVKIKDGKVIEQFESLVNTAQYIPDAVSNLTGINQTLLDSAPPSQLVMTRLVKFIGKKSTLIAHNASFDSRFFHNELELAGLKEYRNFFICTLLLSRRLYQYCSDHKLATIAKYHNINFHGSSHRAMPDTLVTAQLFINILHDLEVHNMIQKEFDEIAPLNIMIQQKTPAYKFLQTAKRIHNAKNNKRKHIPINKPFIDNSFERITYSNNETYEGDLLNGKRHGKGIQTYKNGDIYEGDFLNDYRHGKGIYTWPDGRSYVGKFIDGNQHGKGIHTLPNGDFEELEYIHGSKKIDI
ncbi:exonuclease domain-containing protein [Methylophilaceae bacterium]|nr:exonuclease domain-containing protein [Methylophilaceae bacterium]